MIRRMHPLPRYCHLLLLSLIAACLPVAALSGASTNTDIPDGTGSIQISDAWIRQPPPGAAAAGAYLRLVNTDTQDDRLLAVHSPAAERVEIHTMQMDSGMMRMRKLENSLALPAGETITLAPGGLHLMLIAPGKELPVGGEVHMRLSFEHAPEQTVVFNIRPLTDEGNMGEGNSKHEHHARH